MDTDGPDELGVVLLYQPLVREEARRLAKGLRAFPAQARSPPRQARSVGGHGRGAGIDRGTGAAAAPTGQPGGAPATFARQGVGATSPTRQGRGDNST